MIGTETEADIRHVLFNNCVIRNSNKGFGINVQDGATVSDVIVSNLTIETGRRHWNWWGSAEMCKLVAEEADAGVAPRARFATSWSTTSSRIRAAPARSPVTPSGRSRTCACRTSTSRCSPENAVDKRATDALRLEHVRGARIRDLSVRWSEDATEPKWAERAGPAARRRVRDRRLRRPAGPRADGRHPAIAARRAPRTAPIREPARDRGMPPPGPRHRAGRRGTSRSPAPTCPAGVSAVTFEPPDLAAGRARRQADAVKPPSHRIASRGCRLRRSAPRSLPPSRVDAGQGGLPRLDVTNALARAQIYLHGAHVTAWQPAGHDPVLWMSRREPVGRGQADPRRRADLLPLVRPARDRHVGAGPRLRAAAGLDARRGA